jgi:hypothetical protein
MVCSALTLLSSLVIALLTFRADGSSNDWPSLNDVTLTRGELKVVSGTKVFEKEYLKNFSKSAKLWDSSFSKFS